ncbi:3-keto-disaccharide hydrolase [Candidatus Laterigemmans baculatus]|uniref:3-keto-disaccharide hydrolase n=1 Tax=Candidatus Laterigemmans baculatus TaxID=2770505 RepID=UPI0013DA0CB3|nr:DUF1080 domain-containing protein [Candidatus Laterigemmans baculatus]
MASTSLAAEDEAWIQLFNGKNLDGWTVKIRNHPVGENFGNTFRVEDGLLTVRYDQYDTFDEQFGHLFYRDAFSHYRLRVEYRFIGEQCPGGPGWAFRNSGVMLHGQKPETMTVDQRFPVSVEAQLLGGDGVAERTTSNVCTPGTHIVIDGERITRHCNSSRSKTYHGDQWVTAEFEVRGGDVIKHILDGQVVLKYEKPQYDPSDSDAQRLIASDDLLIRQGTISLQSESHPVQFRKVELLPLKP